MGAPRRSRSSRRGLVHTDGAFDADELVAFLLGAKVECRSTWISAARWQSDTATLTLTVISTGKDYDFPGIDYEAATDFAQSHSKGVWYHVEWKGKYGTDMPYALDPTAEPGYARRTGG